MALLCNSEARRLADQLARSHHGGAWHGPATQETLRDIDAATAGRRPKGSPHTIIEHVRHLTFWLEAAYRRIHDGRDVAVETDWQTERPLTEKTWVQAIAELDQAHAKLYTMLLNLDDQQLDAAVAGSDPTVRGLLLGTLQHNAYHTGQIVQLAQELAR